MERKELLMIIMLGVLLLTTAMQTLALAGLSGQTVVTGKSVAASPAPSQSVQSSSAGSLSDLPSMVGGC